MPYVKKKVPADTNNITTGIVNYLLSRGHSASRVNVMGIYDELQQQWRKSGSRTGFYDIACVIKTKYGIGLALFVDTKRGKDKLRKDQIEFKIEVESAGAVTFESKDYNDFVVWFETVITPKYL